jgi:hypothetical protein
MVNPCYIYHHKEQQKLFETNMFKYILEWFIGAIFYQIE